MWVDAFVRDGQYGVRSLLKNPGFSALAIVSLATGIMATTAIYSVLHAVVLDPFPYKDVDQLMSVRISNPAARGGRLGYSVDQFLEIADRNRIFDGVIARPSATCCGPEKAIPDGCAATMEPSTHST